MAFAVVGTPVTAHTAAAASLALPAFTASGSNLVIVVAITASTSRTVTAISDTAGLTWVFRCTTAGGTNPIEEWYAQAPSGVSATVITVTVNASATLTIHCAAFSGVRVSSTPWEQNITLPQVGGGNNSTITPIAINTTTANTLLIGLSRTSDTANIGGSGWTQLVANNNFLFEYQIVSAAQTGTTISLGSAATPNAQIGDALAIDGTAIRFAPAGGCPTLKITSGSTIAIPFSCEGTNLAIFAGAAINGATIASIADTAGLTWTRRARTVGTTFPIEYWWAPAPSGLSGATITLTLSTTTTNGIGFVFAVAGARLTPNPFDQYSTSPQVAGGSGTNVGALSVGTATATALVLGLYRASATTATAGSGFGLLAGFPNLCLEFQPQTSTQSALSVPLGGASTTNGGIVDGLVDASVPWVQLNAANLLMLLEHRL